MPGPFVERFRAIVEPLFGRRLTEDDGVVEAQLTAVEKHTGYELPESLRDFYTVLHYFEPVMGSHHRFYNPSNLARRDDKLIFCEENQVVVYWGYEADEGWRSDPPVYQGVNNDELEWYLEKDRCSEFLAGMIYWQSLMGGLPHFGYARATEVAYQAAAAWPLVWQDEDTQLFSRGPAVFGLTRSEGEVKIQAAGLLESDLAEVSRLFGVEM